MSNSATDRALAGAAAVQLDGVTKRFGEVQALSEATLAIRQGLIML